MRVSAIAVVGRERWLRTMWLVQGGLRLCLPGSVNTAGGLCFLECMIYRIVHYPSSVCIACCPAILLLSATPPIYCGAVKSTFFPLSDRDMYDELRIGCATQT